MQWKRWRLQTQSRQPNFQTAVIQFIGFGALMFSSRVVEPTCRRSAPLEAIVGLLWLHTLEGCSVGGGACSFSALGVLGYVVASTIREPLQMNHCTVRSSVVGVNQPLGWAFPTRAISGSGTPWNCGYCQNGQRKLQSTHSDLPIPQTKNMSNNLRV